MKALGLGTGADIKRLSESELTKHFGKTGRFFYKIVRGVDDRPVQPHRRAKSISAEDTFPQDLATLKEMERELEKIGELVHERLAKNHLQGRTITLKIKYHDFRQITRSKSFPYLVADRDTIADTAKGLLAAAYDETQKVRLLGISLSNFSAPGQASHRDEEGNQLGLF